MAVYQLFSMLGLFFLSIGLLMFFLTGKTRKSVCKNPPLSTGATNYPVVGILLDFIKNRERYLEWITDILSNSPSNTFTLQRPGGVRSVVTANPANVEHILKTHFDNYPKGERSNFFFHDFLGKGIFNVDGDLWKMQRKAASHEFNTKSLRNFVVETVQWEIRNCLMVVLWNACERGESLDLQDILQRFAFDNICRVAFGVDPGCLHPSLPTSRFAHAFEDAADISSGRVRYAIPYLWRIKRMLNLGSERRLREAIHVVDEFALDIIRSRRNELSAHDHRGMTVREDLLSRFMTAIDSMNETYKKMLKFSENEKNGDLFLKDMMVSFILAGRDTTSSSLTWFFWFLSSHPRVEEAIHHEILHVLSRRNAQTDEDGQGRSVLFSYEELKEMNYLHAALCESLRLYPAVPLNFKVAVNEDILPADGTFVGKGWFVSYCPYSMGRMESIWGSDCLEFKPERWLKNGEFQGEKQFKFAVFQPGPRICLGKDMALIQMKSIVASVIERFRIKVEDRYSPKYVLSLAMRMERGLPVTLILR
eukprot:Gb_36523 [translate_table: standard]